MPYYDVYGTFHFENINIELFTDSTYDDNQNVELFVGPTCVERPEFLCSSKATGYKSCVIDGKNEECCNTCKQFTTCNDNIDCPNQVNDPKNYKENGLCKDSFWNKCCASCNNKLNNYNNNYNNYNNNACVDRLRDCNQRTDQCSIEEVSNYYCCNTCRANKNQPPTQQPTQQPTQKPTQKPTHQTTGPIKDLLPDCRKYSNSCNQNNPSGELMNYFCNDTCNNTVDNINNCSDFINQCNDNSIIGSALRNYYCKKTCNNL